MKNDGVEVEEVDVYKVILQLRQENLLIRDEKRKIQELNELIGTKIHNIIKESWITTKQRLLLYERETSTKNYANVDCLVNSEFVDAKHSLGFQNAIKIGNLLEVLRTQPAELAKWLIAGEQLADESLNYSMLLEHIVVGLYGCFIFPEDTKYMLTLLYELVKLQMLDCNDPKRIIKQLRTCSFKRLYFLFHEVLHSARFFLSAAMEIPIIQMMSCSEYYLDIDPAKTNMRFRQNEHEVNTMFNNLEDYRRNVIAKLVEFTNMFVSSLLDNVYSFPKSVAWIVSQISKIIEKSFSTKQANAIVTELIFTLYICPVILDPEQYGICMSQITDIVRHNLIQICQILQSLALTKHEPTDPRFCDLFDLLDKNRVSNFIELLFFDMDCEEPPVESSPDVTRDIMLFTDFELNNLLCILQKIKTRYHQNENFQESAAIEEQLSALTISSTDNSPKSSRLSNNEENSSKISNFFAMATKTNSVAPETDDPKPTPNTVLVFPIEGAHTNLIGLLPEEKIIDLSGPLQNGDLFDVTPSKVEHRVPDTPPRNGDLKQAFTYLDEMSIGNTSDNLEAISEAASNHSVDSSIELENEDQNDNLSDMVSANVSGRGTPNISGRDTPSSQVCEGDERPLAEPRGAADAVARPPPALDRQIRSEIDDKFCKFEIKKLLEGDETISIISETWSTDVLASDNEAADGGGGGEPRLSLPLVETIQEAPNVLDLSETQSESAWSTDVMTSDTERLTEVDNDDSVSVAQSDDTRSETDDGAAAASRRPSAASTASNPAARGGGGDCLPASSPNAVSNTRRFVTSSKFQEYRKIDVKNDRINGKIYQTDTYNNANRVFKPVSLEHSQSLTETNEIKTVTVFKSVAIRAAGSSKDLELNNVPGPSGILGNDKIPPRPSEILLSNCSLNSSSSGSSSFSFENKNSEKWESKQWLNSSGSSLNVTLTPSESISEMSVLSISKKNPPAAAPGRSASKPPSASTGAIPKSISFDTSADKGAAAEEEGGGGGRSKRGGFFGKLRIGFRKGRGKSLRAADGEFAGDGEEPGGPRRAAEPLGRTSSGSEVSDDILAKYRTKPDSNSVKENCDPRKSLKEKTVYNCTSEEINSFNDVKNKLRLVLSNTSEIPHYIKNNPISTKSKIETVLRLELGKARRLREWYEVAGISEAIRCLSLLTDDVCRKLMHSIRQDIASRSTYLQYLMTSRKELLFCDSFLNSLQNQVSYDKKQCEKYLATVCVREFLREQEALMAEFCEEFKQLSLSDEKCDFLHNFHLKLFYIMKSNPFWKGIVPNREDRLKITLERFIMKNTYKYSIYPNGDGDRDRDRVLHNHIEKLSKIIAPNHKDLLIDKAYLRESPWLPAQDALGALNACKTPRDKVKCVVHCAKCVMYLLALSQTGGSATADDLMPVLVYVIIKVNPEALLSTIQYVNSFFHNQLFGEEEYYWTQFCAAVEYIKTMDYSD